MERSFHLFLVMWRIDMTPSPPAEHLVTGYAPWQFEIDTSVHNIHFISYNAGHRAPSNVIKIQIWTSKSGHETEVVYKMKSPLINI